MNEKESKAVALFKRNEEIYRGHSDKFLSRITADELSMHKDELMSILEEHYED